ncbi:MAG: hypothetical protein M3467_10500, partial [Actinomycetota bacterium]|nr:hypothetical protein [Actinomycetota bacterium]
TSRHEPESLLDANRVGRIHAHPTAAGWTWWEYLSCPNPRGFVAEVADTLPFPTPRSVPAATAPTLTWRCITATLMSAVLDVHRLRALNGVLDSSGGDGGLRRGQVTP